MLNDILNKERDEAVMDYVQLNNGVKMPQLGLGVYKVTEEEIERAVKAALESGYRAIDTAQFYENEKALGNVLKETDIPREDLFITTKVWNSHQGYEKTLEAFDASLEKLGLEYVDLYLVHWPCPDFDLYIETYRALEKLYNEGKVKAIGVSNFNIEHLERLLKECDVTPVLNQVECHPYLQQQALKAFCREHDIHVEAWAPLMKGKLMEDEVIKTLATKHQKTPAQIILRWHLQNETIVIPKSVTPSRIKENIDVFDFALTKEDMEEIATLDRGERQGKEPNEMHLQ